MVSGVVQGLQVASKRGFLGLEIEGDGCRDTESFAGGIALKLAEILHICNANRNTLGHSMWRGVFFVEIK